MHVKDFFTQSKYLFGLSIIFAFLFPGAASSLKPFILPALVVMMTLSLKGVMFYRPKKRDLRTILSLLAVNYVLLSGLYILAGFFFINDIGYKNALFVFALMPPAIGIISLSYLFHGKTEIGFIAEFISYVAALLIVPIGSFFLFRDAVGFFSIVRILFYVIIIPLILSRLLVFFEKRRVVVTETLQRSLINVLYGVLFYTIIGENRNSFFTQTGEIITLFGIFFFLKFGLGTVMYLLLRKRIEKNVVVLYILFATLKNWGAAIALIITFFGISATLPLAVNAIIFPFFVVYSEWLLLHTIKRKGVAA